MKSKAILLGLLVAVATIALLSTLPSARRPAGSPAPAPNRQSTAVAAAPGAEDTDRTAAASGTATAGVGLPPSAEPVSTTGGEPGASAVAPSPVGAGSVGNPATGPDAAAATPPAPPGVVPGRRMKLGGLEMDFSTPEARDRTVDALSAIDAARLERVRRWAEEHGVPTSEATRDGGIRHIFDIEDDMPVHMQTLNAVAAVASGVPWLRERTLEGKDMIIGVWDGGLPLTTHVEFGDRVSYRPTNSTTLNSHATHVIGTIAGAGEDPVAVGMAPAAFVEAYSFNGEVLAEMGRRGAAIAAEVGDVNRARRSRRISISSHSWGPVQGWNASTDPAFDWSWSGPADPSNQPGTSRHGGYGGGTWSVDQMAAAQPYHLAVFAAGNDRTDNPRPGDRVQVPRGNTNFIETYSAAVHPPGDGFNVPGGYRSILGGLNVGKNLLTVGAVEHAVDWFPDTSIGSILSLPLGVQLRATRDISRALPTSFTGFGPTIDGRLKPEIVASGSSLYSADLGDGDDYSRKSGTSMATPVVSGAALLLQERHLNLFNRPMRASTLKALLLHTADDLGIPGPDYQTGYGLLNATEAERLISAQWENRSAPILLEEALVAGRVEHYELFVPTLDKVTLTWTDPVDPDQTNNFTGIPEHDLDLRVISGEGRTLRPAILSPTNPGLPATTGDNSVDTTEQVWVPPTVQGPYRIVVTSKRPLEFAIPRQTLPVGLRHLDSLIESTNAPAGQVFSLILTGAARSFGSLAEALDSSVLRFTPGGTSPALGWIPQSVVTRDGVDAVLSRSIGDNQRSWIETNVEGPGELWFSVLVRTAPGNGFQLEVDGTPVAGLLDGNSGWREQSRVVGPGTHRIRWVHSKNRPELPEGDAVFLDQVVYLQQPRDLVATRTGSVTDLSWRSDGDGDGYRLYSNPVGPFLSGAAQSTVTAPDHLRAVDVGNPPGTWYAVDILHSPSGRHSPLSRWVQSTVRLLRPTAFQASVNAFPDRIRVRWDPVASASEYVLTRTPQGGNPTTIRLTATTYDDIAVQPGGRVAYTLVARDPVTGAASPEAGPVTGSVLDPSTLLVDATDGQAGRVRIAWGNPDGTDWFRCLRTTTAISPGAGNRDFVEIGRNRTSAESGRWATFHDFTAQIGLTYHYWAQVGRYDPSGNGQIVWGVILGSDTGRVATPGTVEYRITDSNRPGGPDYHWVDISRIGTRIHGRQLITPTSAAVETGSQFFPVARLVDDSGLSAPATIGNLASVRHGVAGEGTAWVTDANVPDYYTALPPPKLLFRLPLTNPETVGFELTDLVLWGYHFGTPGANEGRVFQLEFLRRTNVQGDLAPTGQRVTVTSPEILADGGAVLPLGGRYFADAVRMTITDNWYGLFSPGGDRVGLGEVKFIGHRRNAGTGPSVHGYIAVSGTDDLLDSTNDCPLPVVPANPGQGIRVLPWHDALDTHQTGAVFVARGLANVHPAGFIADVYQWEDVRPAGGGAPFSFQALHFTGTGDWLYQYKPGHPAATGATIGIQDLTAGTTAAYSCNSDSIPTDRAFAVLFKAAPTAPAAVEPGRPVWTVTTLVDEDSGGLGSGSGDSLREIVKYTTGAVEIVFPATMAGRTLAVTSPIVPQGNVILDGSAAPGLVISGRNQNQILRLESLPRPEGGTLEVEIRNLTLSDGSTDSHGGAIATAARLGHTKVFLHMENVTVRNSRARNGGKGGGIAITDDANLTLVNCTLSGCRSEGGGGAIWLALTQPAFRGRASLVHCTVANNVATGGEGGGILADNPNLRLTASIIANNSAPAGGGDIRGVVESTGRNVVLVTNGVTGLAASDRTGADPRLGALANNGGGTPTHALRPDSPAIDFAMGSAGEGVFLATDQRGIKRGADGDLNPGTGPGGPDSGAFELVPELVVTTAADVADPHDGVVSFREAVGEVNRMLGGRISFDPVAMGTNVVNLRSPITLEVPRGLTVAGAGVTVVGNLPSSTARLVVNRPGSFVLFEDLTFASAETNRGPGIRNQGEMGVVRCTVRLFNAEFGGGIFNEGRLFLSDSTLCWNRATERGGALHNAGGAVSIRGCTLSGNSALLGSAMMSDGGTVEINASTIAWNMVGIRAAILTKDTVGTVSDSVLVEMGSENIGSLDGRTLTESGINLIVESADPRDPLLLPLGDHGGPAWTMPPVAGSPALDRLAQAAPIRVAGTAPEVADVNSPAGMGPGAAFDGDPSTAFVSLDPALVAHWPLDRDPAASVGPWNGVASGNLTFGHDPAPGLSGRSVDFVQGSIRVPWNEALNPESFTVTLWARADIRGGGVYRSPFTNREGAGRSYGYMLYNDDRGDWNFWSASGTTSLWDTLPGGSVQTGQWMHLAVSYDNATRVKRIYVNGVQVGQATVPIQPNGPGRQSLKIGAGGDDDDGLANPFDGRIDDVALWNRSLDAAGIAGIMARGVRPVSPGLVLRADNPFLAANAIRLTAAANDPDADPTRVTLEGSDDGVAFEWIGESVIPPFATRGGEQLVEIPSQRAYRHYRLALTGSRSPSAGRMQIGEIQLVHMPRGDQRGLPRLAGRRVDLGAVEAGVLVVDTVVDENNGSGVGKVSLRDAVQASRGGIIRFDPAVFRGREADRIVLAHGPLVPPAGVSIDASDIPGGITVSGAGVHRIMEITDGVGVLARNLTLRQGFHASHGGAVRVAGDLYLYDCRVVENTSRLSGGGIDVDSGTLSMHRCTVASNTAGQPGGGIRAVNGSYIDLAACTLARNNGGVAGGIRAEDSNVGIFQSTLANHAGAAIQGLRSSIGLSGCTVSANATGIARQGNTLITLENCIVAGNTGTNIEGPVDTDRGGNLTAGNPRLAPLGAHGGPTETMPLRIGSPALNAATPAADAIRGDQRGFPRRFGPADIGAFESHALGYVSIRDLDGDGIDDAWEVFHGLDPANAADALRDLDGDGRSNRDEFIARTDPTDRNSQFRTVVASHERTAVPAGQTTTVTWTSTPGLVYSAWSSEDLRSWTPVEDSNLIALGVATSLAIRSGSNQRFYHIRVGAAPGIAPAVPASVDSSLLPVASWNPDGLTPALNGQRITAWREAAGQGEMTAAGGPVFSAGASPIGIAAAQFRGGAFNDAFSGNTPAAFRSTTNFAVVVVFNPTGNGESVAGSRYTDKSQLLSANSGGASNGWGLAYADNAVWFGVGDASSAQATLRLPAGTTMLNRWWIAVASWQADDGTGKPSVGVWLYDEEGNEVSRMDETDPNLLAGSQRAFVAPRSNPGIAVGGDRSAIGTRNFTGRIISARLYRIPVGRTIASTIAAQLATEYTTVIRPE